MPEAARGVDSGLWRAESDIGTGWGGRLPETSFVVKLFLVTESLKI